MENRPPGLLAGCSRPQDAASGEGGVGPVRGRRSLRRNAGEMAQCKLAGRGDAGEGAPRWRPQGEPVPWRANNPHHTCRARRVSTWPGVVVVEVGNQRLRRTQAQRRNVTLHTRPMRWGWGFVRGEGTHAVLARLVLS